MWVILKETFDGKGDKRFEFSQKLKALSYFDELRKSHEPSKVDIVDTYCFGLLGEIYTLFEENDDD